MSSRLIVAIAAIVALAACSRSTTAPPVHEAYYALLTGRGETSAAVTTGKASFHQEGFYVLTPTFYVTGLSFVVSVMPMSGPATAVHIHIGRAGEAGPVVVTFTTAGTADGTVAAGTVNLDGYAPIGRTSTGTATIGGDSLFKLFRSGNAYVDIHTAASPGGDLRGQIIVY